MNKPLSPVVSPFETEDEADQHDRWFREQVEASLADQRPAVPHDEVMGEMRHLLRRKQNKDAG